MSAGSARAAEHGSAWESLWLRVLCRPGLCGSLDGRRCTPQGREGGPPRSGCEGSKEPPPRARGGGDNGIWDFPGRPGSERMQPPEAGTPSLDLGLTGRCGPDTLTGPPPGPSGSTSCLTFWRWSLWPKPQTACRVPKEGELQPVPSSRGWGEPVLVPLVVREEKGGAGRGGGPCLSCPGHKDRHGVQDSAWITRV